MYKLLFFFALMALAFAAPAPAPAPGAPAFVFSQPFGYSSPYLQAGPVIYPAAAPAAAYPAIYPGSPITYTKYF